MSNLDFINNQDSGRGHLLSHRWAEEFRQVNTTDSLRYAARRSLQADAFFQALSSGTRFLLAAEIQCPVPVHSVLQCRADHAGWHSSGASTLTAIRAIL
jgi:hypothetical protein